MDESILLKNGVDPINPRTGYLEHYALNIGERASLIPSDGERSYGILMTVDPAAIRDLYAEPSVADYIPEEVLVTLENNEQVQAICYNLPAEALKGTNSKYARALYELASKRGFPEDYLEKILMYVKE